jgi:hypothetical protein
MAKGCEVCGSKKDARAVRSAAAKLRRFLVADRVMMLCDGHAAVLRAASPCSLPELRALFRETWGKRSLVARRAPLDRRLFPARPEGRRLGRGRRASDLDE